MFPLFYVPAPLRTHIVKISRLKILKTVSFTCNEIMTFQSNFIIMEAQPLDIALF